MHQMLAYFAMQINNYNFNDESLENMFDKGAVIRINLILVMGYRYSELLRRKFNKMDCLKRRPLFVKVTSLLLQFHCFQGTLIITVKLIPSSQLPH